MLDNDTKRRIDEARDILVGKVPTPQSQVEQITIALIYKFMDDMDKESVSLGGNAVFFSGEYEKYSWTKIFDPRLGGFDIINLYSEAIEKLNHNPNIPQLFRDIFKNAYLPYRDPETLKLFLKTINEFHYDHSERLGDAFEYLLSVLGSQGDAGQFRTPRHIIDFIVSVVEPKKSDSILDPSCGTAGFLISSYKFILEQNTKKSKGDLLTPIERKRLMTNFYGYDISPDMVRLSLVNMYLHGFTTPLIFEYDTLTSEDRWGDTFDVILANPPFMTPKGGIKPHKKFTLQVNRSEVLFVDYIAEHINPVSGRAGIIVPEGIIFQSSNAYKQLRKMLVDSSLLYAVVSLPAGVFNPYAGVKTSILLLDKSLAKKTDKILFVKIENDGFDLGAQRREVEGSNLPNAKDLIINFKESILTKSEFISDNKNVFLIEKSKIASKEDYNLSIDRLKSDDVIQVSNFKVVRLEDVCEIERGGSPRPIQNFISKTGDGINWIKIGDAKVNDKYIYSTKEKIIKEGVKSSRMVYENDFILSNSMSFGRPYIMKTSGCIHDGWLVLRLKSDILNPDYLYSILSSENIYKQFENSATGGVVRNLNIKLVKDIKIPLPPLSVQKEIVAKIENYQAIIKGAKQVVENYKPQIDINPDWKMVELGDLSSLKNGINYTKDSVGEEVRILGVKDFKNSLYAPLENFDIVQIDNKLSDEYCLKENDLVFVRSNGNPDLVGRTVIIPKLNFISTFSGFTIRLRFLTDKTLPLFYVYLLKSDYFRKKLIDSGTGANIKSINQPTIKSLLVPLPSLEEQQEIVSRIEKEQSIINSNKELIKIYEQKIKDKINKLWKQD